MKRRFVAAINSLGESVEYKFARYLDSMDVEWWHWVENFWLIVDESDTMNVAMIRDQFMRLMPGMWHVVFEVDRPSDWTGFGPRLTDFNMEEWVERVWMAD